MIFERKNPLFSLCGLNCGLCSMKLDGHCPGCGRGNSPCKAARCGMEHHVEYCFTCKEYPCSIYEHADDYDSFITHLHQKADLEKAKTCGIEAYNTEQTQKVELLDELLHNYNAGREKTLYCLAVNLLEVEEIRSVLAEAKNETANQTLKERATFVSTQLREIASNRNLELKLRKKR